ncbi:MAG: M48 family metalloprotease [Hyphomonadaceae bacterium]|nr:M48 family metalloprotease [Hyphomonadaceae bacterium]
MTPFLDASSQRAHKARNTLHSALLVAGLGLLTGFSAWLIWGGMGVAVTLVAIGVIYAFAPRLPPEVLMRMYRGRPLDPRNGGAILHIADVLSDRAELPAPPQVYVIPSMTLNAFATGTPQKAMIGVTEGLLRRLTLNELAGVLAHEISHIRNNDLAVMSLADVMTRFTQVLSYLALFLALFNLPALLLGDAEISLAGLALLYLAPTVGSLIQLALSRTREHDADLEGASLTGDPASLASALEKLERYRGRFWEDMTLPIPGRRIPQPSLLRSHPSTEERIARLRALQDRPMLPQLSITEEPMVSLVGLGPIAMRPRYRWTGVWF